MLRVFYLLQVFMRFHSVAMLQVTMDCLADTISEQQAKSTNFFFILFTGAGELVRRQYDVNVVCYKPSPSLQRQMLWRERQ